MRNNPNSGLVVAGSRISGHPGLICPTFPVCRSPSNSRWQVILTFSGEVADQAAVGEPYGQDRQEMTSRPELRPGGIAKAVYVGIRTGRRDSDSGWLRRDRRPCGGDGMRLVYDQLQITIWSGLKIRMVTASRKRYKAPEGNGNRRRPPLFLII
jgi:hypothetical protein